MAAPKPGTDVVPFNDYAVAKQSTEEFIELLRENVGDGTFTERDLTRVKVPLGGGRTWSVPTLDGEPLDLRELDGVIMYHREPRAYWKNAFTGEGNPPDCSSQFGDVGVGDPGGECKTCPMAQFGSKIPMPGQTESRGQACKQMKLVLMLRPGSMLPTALFLPPTSIKELRSYMLRLADAGQRFSSVITRLTLDTTKSADGIEYSTVRAVRLESLDDAAAAQARQYSVDLKDILDTIEIAFDDVEETTPTAAPVDPEVAAAAEALGAEVEGEWDGSTAI